MKRSLGSGILATTAAIAGYSLASSSSMFQAADTLPPQVEAVYTQSLKQAEDSARESKFAQAIEQIEGIPPNSRSSQTANQLRHVWEQELLQQAQDNYQVGNVPDAVAKLKSIAQSSPVAAQAKTLQTTWTKQLQRLDRVEKSVSAQKWQQAISAIESLRGTGLFDTPHVQAMLEQALTNSITIDNATQAAMMSLPSAEPIPPESMSVSLVSPAAPPLSPVAMSVNQALEVSKRTAPDPLKPPRPAPIAPLAPLPPIQAPVQAAYPEFSQPASPPTGVQPAAPAKFAPTPIPVPAPSAKVSVPVLAPPLPPSALQTIRGSANQGVEPELDLKKLDSVLF